MAAAASCRLLRLAPHCLRSPRHSLFPTPLALSLGWRRYCAAAPPVAATAMPTGDAVGEFRRRIRVAEVKGGEDQGTSWVGKELTVRGWVRTCRAQRTVTFVEVNDGSCLSNMQCVLTPETEGYDQIDSITTGASVLVEGVVASSQGGKQKVDLKVSKIIVIGESDPTSFPIQKKRASREFLRTVAHLRPRTNTFGAVARVRNALAYATHNFFQDNGFIWVSSPIITASDCEGAGEQFYVTTLLSNSAEGGCLVNSIPSKDGRVDWSQDFFCKPAFLTVSGQLNGETYASALSDIYTFGPTFRAENSNTSRHLAEFWMIEPELAFADLNDDMACASAYLQYVNVAEKNFVQMSYSDAIKLLIGSNKKFEFPVKWGLDLQSEHERYITEVAFGGHPVIIRDYPKEIKAFYMRQNDDGKTVAAMDLLVPRVGELIGGSQREERLDYLEARLDESNLNKDSYWWYLDLRRYGSVPHAGFGLGFERLVQFATGIDNIRDAIPFPRVPGSAEF
ncbi:asparagine--tRNA ligase, chloroplastic/mitochondrial isoform X3 [Hordeum vulgare subsp. vulgare]|uniref:asparagine--tRNA ligase, chloroplastic/mitochondrial isoform X3 n=1 Tax=Hordeum vulgare subsp. vulgare TaxID=112509 RepID=UPI001D1A3A1C|nr:asparagine--tRNA ligase, chloroplastic/mitochondrial isoform X3 [Hordeum vulgare subsp. vulgare]